MLNWPMTQRRERRGRASASPVGHCRNDIKSAEDFTAVEKFMTWLGWACGKADHHDDGGHRSCNDARVAGVQPLMRGNRSAELVSMLRRDLLGADVAKLWRLAVISADNSTSLPFTLVIDVGGAFVLITYSDVDGFVTRPPTDLQGLHWRGVEIDEGEAFGLAPLEHDQEVPELPFRADWITTWIGIGCYIDLLVVALEDKTHRLVVQTTDDTLRCTGLDDALGNAARVARHQKMGIERDQLCSSDQPRRMDR